MATMARTRLQMHDNDGDFEKQYILTGRYLCNAVYNRYVNV